MHFVFTLDSSDIDLWDIDLLDAHVDLLDTDIPSKHFVCLQDVLKTCSRHIFKTSPRHAFKTSSGHAFKTSPRYIFKMSSRSLQRNNFSFSKMVSRRLGRRKIFTLKTSWRPTNVCWDDFSIDIVRLVSKDQKILYCFVTLLKSSEKYCPKMSKRANTQHIWKELKQSRITRRIPN